MVDDLQNIIKSIDIRYIIGLMSLQELKLDSIPTTSEFPNFDREVGLVSEQAASLHRRIYYQLKEGVYFIPGVKRAAVCDTGTGNVYSINETAKRIILGEIKDPEFSEQLRQMNLMDDKAVPTQRENPNFQLDFVWFEIVSDDCNERCLHCYADSMPQTYRKRLLNENLSSQELTVSTLKAATKLPAQRWRELIDESYNLGCRATQFIGGEPFIWKGQNGESVLDLAEYARTLGYEFIEIFTNATQITPNKVTRIKELGLNIAVSLYSDNPEVHDQITRTPGSFRKTTQALEVLRLAQVPTRVETVLMKPNQQTAESTGNFIQQMEFSHRAPDVLRPKGRGDDSALQPDPESLVRYGLILGPDFSAQPDFFQRSVEGHNCLAGKITITDNGNVLPCIFSREQIVGNVRTRNLAKVLEGKIQDIWQTTKDDVLVCQDCEYRYVCFDCRPISEGASCGNGQYETAPYPRCTYNPYEGKWGGGTWKVDDKGKPYYDETLKPIIEKVRTEGVSSKPQGH